MYAFPLVYGQWNIQNTISTNRLNSICFVDSLKGWVVGNKGLIMHSIDGGKNWSIQNSNTTSELTSVSFYDSTEGWAVGYGGWILHTTDGGKKWKRIIHDTTSITRNDKVQCLSYFDVVISRSQLYEDIYGGYKLWKSTDEGASWDDITPSNTLRIIDFTFKSPTKGWLINLEQYNGNVRIRKTNNAGELWESQSINPFYSAHSEIYFENALRGWTSDGSHLYKTTDGGNSWNLINSTVFDTYFFAGLYMNGPHGYINYYKSISKTIDSGKTWNSQLLPTSNIDWFTDAYFLSENSGWAISSNGIIFNTTNGGVTNIKETTIPIVSQYELRQNYPNPFNPSTIISFKLIEKSSIKLLIYNIYGEMIESKKYDDISPGEHIYEWVPKNIASGVYYYTIQCNTFSETRKALYVK